MIASEFIITKFERNNPELLKMIEDWTAFSIEQNFDCVKIILNEYTVPNCPELNTFNEKKERKSWVYLNETCAKISDYFSAKGFKRVEVLFPVSLKSPKGEFISGHCICAYFK